MPFRTVFFWFHLITGVTASAIVLVMSATGVLLMYEKQVVQWAESGPSAAPPTESTQRLPIEALLRGVVAHRPDVIPTTLTVSRAHDAPAVLALGRDAGVLLINPYSGRVIRIGSSVRSFLRTVTEGHRWLGRSGDRRAAGRAVAGVANLAFLCLVLSGMYIWLPRFWTWRQLRLLVWFHRSATPKAREFNWHHAFGFWAAIPLVVVVASGVVMSYPWASALVYRVAGEAPPSVPAGAPRGERGPGGSGRDARHVPLDGLNTIWARAEAVDGWRTITLRLPTPRDRQVIVTVDSRHGRATAQARSDHSGSSDRCRRRLGAIRVAQPRTTPALDCPVRAYRGSAWPHRPDDRRRRLLRRSDACLHGRCVVASAVCGVAAPP